MKDKNSLAHTQWRCKYHLVFAPKYRRQIIYGKYKKSIGEIIRELCERKNVEIHEANACKEHNNKIKYVFKQTNKEKEGRMSNKRKEEFNKKEVKMKVLSCI